MLHEASVSEPAEAAGRLAWCRGCVVGVIAARLCRGPQIEGAQPEDADTSRLCADMQLLSRAADLCLRLYRHFSIFDQRADLTAALCVTTVPGVESMTVYASRCPQCYSAGSECERTRLCQCHEAVVGMATAPQVAVRQTSALPHGSGVACAAGGADTVLRWPPLFSTHTHPLYRSVKTRCKKRIGHELQLPMFTHVPSVTFADFIVHPADGVKLYRRIEALLEVFVGVVKAAVPADRRTPGTCILSASGTKQRTDSN